MWKLKIQIANSFFEACVVGAQKNRLIEMAVLSTPNFCLVVEPLNTISYLSFGACVIGAQKNRLIKMAVLGTLNFCMGVEISNTNIYRSF